MINQEIVQGTLKADGTLVLNGSLKLPPGPVQITVQPLAAPGRRGLVEVMDEIRRDQLARGYSGRTLSEMQAEEAVRRAEDDEYDQRCQSLGTMP